jgi:RNA polymerase sigma factor (TIGR02999 family)
MAEGPAHDDRHDALYVAVYDELKRMARHHLRTRAGGASMNTTDLVHDAYLKLADTKGRDWDSRAHFFGAASQAMRYLLVDHARRRTAAKRGGRDGPTTLRTGDGTLEVQFEELLALDEALDRLRALNERLYRVVELRFFGGMSEEEIAEILGVSARTVERDWTKARLYLARQLGQP